MEEEATLHMCRSNSTCEKRPRGSRTFRVVGGSALSDQVLGLPVIQSQLGFHLGLPREVS